MRSPYPVEAVPVREPPRNVEMEQSLLGSLLSNNKVLDVIAPVLGLDDFSEEIHRRIFEVASSLIAAGSAATPITLQTYFSDEPLYESGPNMRGYLARICAEASLPLLAKDYAAALHELAIRRRVIAVADELADQATDLPVQMKSGQIVGEAVARLHGLVDSQMQTTRCEPQAEAGAIIERIRRVQSGELKKRLISTGFHEVDVATNGFQPSALWIVGARPGVGKTTFFVASANRAARRGAGVLGLALEVGRDQIMARIMADLAYGPHAPLSFKSIMSDDVPVGELRRLHRAQELLATVPLVIDVASRVTPTEIRMRIRAEKARMAGQGAELRVVFIDYLKQIQASNRYKGERHYEVGEISYSLKQIAKDEDLCIVLLAQLNRALESREDKRPILADLRESGDLEADADVVAFLHRESMFIERSAAFLKKDDAAIHAFIDSQHEAELILAKNRAGPTRTVKLWCDMACSSMADHARGQQ